MIADYLASLRLFSRDLRLLLVVYSIMGFGYVGLYAVLFNLYLLRLGYDPEFIGQVNAVGRLGFGLAGIPAGLLGVRFGARRLLLAGESAIVVGLVGAPCVEFLPPFMHTPWLFACCALSFIGFTLFFVNSSPLVMSVTTEIERRHAFSLLGAVILLSAFLGSLAGGVLPGIFATLLGLGDAHPAPYRYPLMIAGCLFVLTIPLVLATSRTPPQQHDNASTQTKPPLLIIALLSVVMMLSSTGIGSTVAFFNVYLDDGLSIATEWIGSITATSQLIAVPAAALMPFLAFRLGNRRTYLVCQCGVALALLPLGLIPHVAAAGAGLVCIAAFSATAGTVFSLYSQSVVEPKWRSLMSGSTFTFMGCSWALTAFLGGYAIEHIGYPALFLGAAAITAAGVVAFALCSRIVETRAAAMVVVSLRPALAGDSDFAFAVKKTAFREYVEQTVGWDEAEQKKLHEQRFASQDFRVVQHSGTDVGILAMERKPGFLKVNGLYILPDHQGVGIGAACMKLVFDEAGNLPVRLQALKVNTRAIAFYLIRLGFVRIGDSDTHVLMERSP